MLAKSRDPCQKSTVLVGHEEYRSTPLRACVYSIFPSTHFCECMSLKTTLLPIQCRQEVLISRKDDFEPIFGPAPTMGSHASQSRDRTHCILPSTSTSCLPTDRQPEVFLCHG